MEIAERLFRGDPVPAIACDYGLSVSSIRFYQQGQRRPRIRAYIEKFIRATLFRSAARLARAQEEAIDELARLVRESEDESIRVQAARALLHEARLRLRGIQDDDEGERGVTVVQVVQMLKEYNARTNSGNGQRFQHPRRMVDVEPERGGNGDRSE